MAAAIPLNKPLEFEALETSSSTIPSSMADWKLACESFLSGKINISPQDRLHWICAFNDFIDTCKMLEKSDFSSFVRLTGTLCDWQLQLKLYRSFPEYTDQHLEHLVHAHWKNGEWLKTYQLLEKQMLLNPDDQNLYHLYCQYVDNASMQGFARFNNEDCSQVLGLEPLSPHHCEEFLWQYWDPSISELCCLPQFNTSFEWHSWLLQQESLEDQSTFAVMHHQWGFIGVVSLIVHGDVGFFYYWIGKDFQQQGLGSEAAALVLELGRECMGISCCYAKVFHYNTPSQKAMNRLGFKRLAFNAAPPNDDELLYYLGEKKTVEQNAEEVELLFQRMDSTTSVDMFQAWNAANE